MKRILKRSLLALFLLALALFAGGWLYLRSLQPEYSGSLELHGLKQPVEVYHDSFGIPHVYAQDDLDAYHALGYLVARERFFQLDLARRAGSGRLAAWFGKPALASDRLYRAMLPEGLIRHQTEQRLNRAGKDIRDEVDAYIAGVNAYVAEGKAPLEYQLIGQEMEPLTHEDLYYIAGYLAYSFCNAPKVEPLLTAVLEQHGSAYLDGMAIEHEWDESYIPSFVAPVSDTSAQSSATLLSSAHFAALDAAPVPPLEGSNSWVVSGAKTKSGKPILCNDTHISLGLPQVWFEAHLEAPGLSLYGNFLPGIPYCLIGHNRSMAWGVTMLLNDDFDYYRETLDPNRPDHYMVDGVSRAFLLDKVRIRVKDAPDTTVVVRSTHRGPVVNDVYPLLPTDQPISCWWTYQRLPNHLLEAFRSLNRCSNVEAAATALSQVAAPGVNITYADTTGNIAWWTVGKWLLRDSTFTPKFILDGSTSRYEPTGVLGFKDNPQAVNPPWHYVYSANDQPDAINDRFYPGHYKPEHRALRIRDLLESRNDWSVNSMQAVINDVTCPRDAALAGEIKEWLSTSRQAPDAVDLELLNWDGRHEVEDIGPTVFYKMLYHTLRLAMADEMGAEWFENYLKTHWMKRSYPFLLRNHRSPWWDNVSTDALETREEILKEAFALTLAELEAQLGNDRQQWHWGKVHRLHLKHPFDRASPVLGKYFNIAEAPYRGGHETVNQAGFVLNGEGTYFTRVGSQMRIIIDMDSIDSSVSVAPSGQSGHRASPHYSDQAEDYRTGRFRRQDMDSERIQQENTLMLLPKR